MNEIRAFVGHSFSEIDQELVRKFLDYFDQVSGILPNFSWTHAQHAEPIDIVDKVLALIEGRNTFIAIVTKNEQIVPKVALRAQLFRKGVYNVSEEKLVWKASDWVIQEIGLAIGRGLSLIILLEDGCRRPGALDGNIEYIPFRREAPSDAFGRLLEMLSTLSPPPRMQGGQAAADSPETEQPGEASPQDESALVPEPSWGREQYEHALFLRMIERDMDGAESITAAYLSTPEGKTSEAKAEWTAKYEFWKILVGQGGSIQRLREQVSLARTSSTLESYGLALSQFGYSDEVGEQFLAAAHASSEQSERVRLLGKAAVSFTKSENHSRAVGAINEMRSIVSDDSSLESNLLRSIRDIAEERKDWELWLEATERQIEINPDSDERFQLAYRYSEEGRNDLALMHYNNIPISKRTDFSWNNLGVSLNQFGMPAKSVYSYFAAANMGSSLAMSNIAYKYMSEGFVDLAEEMFKNGLNAPEPHANAAEGLAKLRRLDDEESTKLGEILSSAKKKVDFYRRLGRAISASGPVEDSGYWRSPVADLELKVVGDRVTLEGKYEQSHKNYLTPGSQTQVVKRSVRYDGRLVGRRVSGTVKRTSDAPPSLLGIGGDADEFSMIFEDQGKISVMENPKSSSPTFYELVRV